MSIVVLGLSHRSAPIALLEAASLNADQAREAAAAVQRAENVTETVVVATCNRIEVYAAALTFHGAVADISAALASVTGLAPAVLNDHLYVHYEDRAIAHAFSVACGLDSMAVGETQILGQLRQALARAQADHQAGPVLNALFQRALRVGKRAHAETAIDRVSASLLDAGLAHAVEVLGPLSEQNVLVIGAGSMSGLAVATLARRGARSITITSRTASRADRLARQYGGRVARLGELPQELREADVVVSCTGAQGYLVTADDVRGSGRDGRPQVFVDLALPRDVAPAVRELPGAVVIGLAELAEHLADDRRGEDDLAQARDLVTAEVAALLLEMRSQQVGPTVAALRSQAARVVAAELDRLDSRLPDLGDGAREEVRRTVHRVVEKLLHTPTVRVKELAGLGQGGDYATALRELFDLDPRDVAAVSSPPDQILP